MTTQTPSTTQRVFTARDHIKENAEHTVQSVYRDQDMGALVEWIEPGKSFEEPHWHPESAHIFVFVEGEGEALVGKGKWEKVKAGQFYICSRNKAHAMRNTSKDKRLAWVCVSVSHGKYVVNPATEHDE